MFDTIKRKISVLPTGEDRGVSPVVGIVMMVGITVVLAAVIGTFMMGLGDGLGDSVQPTSQLTSSTSDGNITITHEGGDELDLTEVKVTAYESGSATENSIETLGNEDTATTLSTGESITFDPTESDSDADEVRLIHEPSDSILITIDY